MLQAYILVSVLLGFSFWLLVVENKEEKKVSKLNAVFCEGGTEKVILITKLHIQPKI